MAQIREVSAPQKRTRDELLVSAKEKDLKAAQFNIAAATGEILTATGDFYESVWKEGTKSGTILLCEMKREDGTKINVPFGFMRTKKRIEVDGVKAFEGAFNDDDTFESMVTKITKGTKFIVCRGEWLKPGWSSPAVVTTVKFAE